MFLTVYYLLVRKQFAFTVSQAYSLEQTLVQCYAIPYFEVLCTMCNKIFLTFILCVQFFCFPVFADTPKMTDKEWYQTCSEIEDSQKQLEYAEKAIRGKLNLVAAYIM